MFSEFDLIQSISGADENGKGKCTISIQPQRCNAEGITVNTDDEYITDKPIVQMFKQAGGFVLVDLIFDSVDDLDLHNVYSYVRNFFLATNSTSDDELDFPIFVLSIIPNKLDGTYWAVGLNPVFYSLTPDDEKGEPKIIRLAFYSQEDQDALPNFLFLKSDTKQLEDIFAEAQDDFDE